MDEQTAYIGLGSNKGNRQAHLRGAVDRMDDHEDIRVLQSSSIYETQAHVRGPRDSRASYLNAVVEMRTSLPPEQLLDLLQNIEGEAGREQPTGNGWAARTLDLDLLVYGTLTRQTERLVVPHPRLAERRFVLAPLAELNPSVWVPAPFERTAEELLAQCSDPYTFEKTDLQWNSIR